MTHTTDSDFEKVPYALPSQPPLPKIGALQLQVAFLVGIKPEFYDCCLNSCCCYTGPHEDLQECPYCHEPQFRTDGKPRKKFTYIPLISHLIAFAHNPKIAKNMGYQAKVHIHTPGITTDTFDGKNYCHLHNQ